MNLINSVRKSDLGSLLTGICSTTESYNLMSSPMWQTQIRPKLFGFKENFTSKVLNIKSKSVLSKQDGNFDFAARGFIKLIDALLYHPTESMRYKAKILNKYVEKFGLSFIHGSYAEQISTAEGIIDKMETQECQNVLNNEPIIGTAYSGFKTSTQTLKNTYTNFLNIQTQENIEITATELKKEIIVFINDTLLPFFKMMSSFQPDQFKEPYQNIVSLVEKTNTTVKMRIEDEEEIIEDMI